MTNHYKILRIKDIMELSEVSKSTAIKIKRLIIKDLNLERSFITLSDYNRFYYMV